MVRKNDHYIFSEIRSVARIRLPIIRRLFSVSAGLESPVTLSHIRIHCAFLLETANTKMFREGVIDTGAKFTVVPEKIWKGIETEIDWLEATYYPTPLRIIGGTYPFRFGRVQVTPIQPDLNLRLDTKVIIAQFPQDGGNLRHVIFGLGGGFFEDRQLSVNVSLNEAWLEQA